VIFLRGVDAGGRSKFAPYVPFDYAGTSDGYATALGAYMDRAARWGIDVLRVPFTWAALEPTQGMNDADWLSRFDQFLAAAWARGIWTVVDFHQDVYSEVFCGDGFPGWTVPDAGPPHHDCSGWSFEYYNDAAMQAAFDRFWAAGSPVQAQYLAAWDVMLARYKDTPGVLGFEPINEPGWGTADEATFTSTTLTSFYSQIVPHFRAAAPSSLVFVDPPGADGAFDMTTLGQPQGDGVVFAPHYYPLSAGSSDEVMGLKVWSDVGTSWNVPVFVGEFGSPNTTPSNVDFMKAIFDALDQLGLAGTEWEYSVSADSWNGEIDSLVDSDGGEFPIAQAVQRPFARAVAGSNVTQSFDTTQNAYSLSFAPSGPGAGITEVSVPKGPFPAGYALQLTGACVDATTVPGRLLLQPDPGASTVTLNVTPK
jgi:endoglycosylceramidase